MYIRLFLFFSTILIFSIKKIYSQNPVPIRIDTFLPDGANQISGLCTYKNSIYLLGEHRYSDLSSKNSWVINTIETNNIQLKAGDSIGNAFFSKKILIEGLDKILSKKMNKAGRDSFEGLESMVILNDTVYFTIETKSNTSDSGFLIRGLLDDTTIRLDTDYFVALPKPKLEDRNIENAGFESMVFYDVFLYIFFEFNNFQELGSNFGFKVNPTTKEVKKIHFNKPLPFRLTDITHHRDSIFFATNFFFVGENHIYGSNLKPEDSSLIKDCYNLKSYARIVKISISKDTIYYAPIFTFPFFPENQEKNYGTWNWEGIVRFRNGILVVNDEFKGKSNGSSIRGTSLVYVDLGL